MRVTAGQHCDNLRNTRNEINELTRLIQRLKAEIEHTKTQVGKKKDKVTEERQAGPLSLGEPQSNKVRDPPRSRNRGFIQEVFLGEENTKQKQSVPRRRKSVWLPRG